MTKVTDDQIIEAAQTSTNMSQAARKVGLHLSSFKNRALKLGLYKPNPQRIGELRSVEEMRKRDIHIDLSEILTGKQPHYGSAHLRRRLIAEGIKSLACEMPGCTTSDPNILYVLDHIDGDCHNHVLSNLRILCPNCHSKTTTFAGKNKKNHKKQNNQFKSDVELLVACINSINIRTALLSLGLKAKGANYKRATRLLELYNFIKCELFEKEVLH